MLPNFLGIGAPRCGTTWVYRLLQTHPQAFVPRKKEIHFFDNNYEKGIEWYEKFFERAFNARAIGEITPAYISTPNGARRIRKTLGDIRLITILRHPADRAYSHYLNVLAARRDQGRTCNVPFREMMESTPRIIEEGLYFKMLQPYLRRFSRNRISILFYDDIVQRPQTVWSNLCNHLEVDVTRDSPWVYSKANSSEDRHGRYKSLRKIQRAFERIGLLSFSGFIRKINATQIPQIPDDIKHELTQLYRDEIIKVQDLTKVDLTHWYAS